MPCNPMQNKIDSLQIAYHTKQIQFVSHEMLRNPMQDKIDSCQIARHMEQINFDSVQMPCNPM
jgi:hypothetical protein